MCGVAYSGVEFSYQCRYASFVLTSQLCFYSFYYFLEFWATMNHFELRLHREKHGFSLLLSLQSLIVDGDEQRKSFAYEQSECQNDIHHINAQNDDSLKL